MTRIPLVIAITLLLGINSHAQAKTAANPTLADKTNPTELSPSVHRFLQEKATIIGKEDKLSDANWDIVISHAKNKRILLLGEVNHGSKEIVEWRNDLIRSLHKITGTQVILFESGIGELACVELGQDTMSPAQMTYGFFENWRTKEFQSLMEFIKTSKISVAGFDVQRSGRSFNNLLKKVATEKNINPVLFIDLEERYGKAQRDLSNKKAMYDSLEQETSRLVMDYNGIYDLLVKDSIAAAPTELLFTLRTISNRIGYLAYMLQFTKDRDFGKRFAARDAMMAANISWLAENIYKKEKIIVIAHNYHIARSNESGLVMGEILSRKYGNEMYSLGFFAGAGSYTGNSGNAEKMLPADSSLLDIKHIIARIPGFASFVNIPKRRQKGDSWLNEHIVVNDSFIDLAGTNKLVLSKQFDGLLLIQKVSPPQKIE